MPLPRAEAVVKCGLLYDLIACVKCGTISARNYRSGTCEHILCSACLKDIKSRKRICCGVADQGSLATPCKEMFHRGSVITDTFFNDRFCDLIRFMKRFNITFKELDRPEPVKDPSGMAIAKSQISSEDVKKQGPVFVSLSDSDSGESAYPKSSTPSPDKNDKDQNASEVIKTPSSRKMRHLLRSARSASVRVLTSGSGESDVETGRTAKSVDNTPSTKKKRSLKVGSSSAKKNVNGSNKVATNDTRKSPRLISLDKKKNPLLECELSTLNNGLSGLENETSTDLSTPTRQNSRRTLTALNRDSVSSSESS